MEPFANIGEVIIFVSLFAIAVVVIPYAFSKVGDGKAHGVSSGEQKSKKKHMDDIL